jgi:ATP-dependent protease ClpP protease subunit
MQHPAIQLPPRPKGLRFEISAVTDARFVLNAEAATIEIFDVIGGPGVNDSRIAGALRSIGARPVTVKINSPGGDPFTGATIYNLLRGHGQKITTQILGMAASAASIVAMAGDRIEVAKNGQAMIHRAQGAAFGDADTMRTVSALLDQTDEAIAGVYGDRTGLPLEQIKKMMAEETFMLADDLLALGFADALLERDAEAAPRQLVASGPRNIRELEERLRGIGLSRAQATRAAAGAWPALGNTQESELDLQPFVDHLEKATSQLMKGSF